MTNSRDWPNTVTPAISGVTASIRAPQRRISPRCQDALDRWPTLLDLLAERRRRGITILDGGDRLVVEDPHGMLTPDFAAALAARGGEILGLLRDCAMLRARRVTGREMTTW